MNESTGGSTNRGTQSSTAESFFMLEKAGKLFAQPRASFGEYGAPSRYPSLPPSTSTAQCSYGAIQYGVMAGYDLCDKIPSHPNDREVRQNHI